MNVTLALLLLIALVFVSRILRTRRKDQEEGE